MLSLWQIFRAYKIYNIEFYPNHKVHFKDMCVELSLKAILHKAKQNKIKYDKIK